MTVMPSTREHGPARTSRVFIRGKQRRGGLGLWEDRYGKSVEFLVRTQCLKKSRGVREEPMVGKLVESRDVPLLLWLPVNWSETAYFAHVTLGQEEHSWLGYVRRSASPSDTSSELEQVFCQQENKY